MDDLTRRDFLRLLGATGIGALSASGLLSGCGGQTPPADTIIQETNAEQSGFFGISRGADFFHTISRRWHNQPLGVGASSTEIRNRHAKSQRATIRKHAG